MNEQQIAKTARAINIQINELAKAQMRRTKNIWIAEDGHIIEILNHGELENAVADAQKRLDDLLWQLDKLIKEQDNDG